MEVFCSCWPACAQLCSGSYTRVLGQPGCAPWTQSCGVRVCGVCWRSSAHPACLPWLQTYVVHSDSVRCVTVAGTGGPVGSVSDADWGTALSGGRDGRVFRTHLASRGAELLVQQQAPVEAVTFDARVRQMFKSHPSCSMRSRAVPQFLTRHTCCTCAIHVRKPVACEPHTL